MEQRIFAEFASLTFASHPPEPEHRALPPSKWLARIFGNVVPRAADLALVDPKNAFVALALELRDGGKPALL